MSTKITLLKIFCFPIFFPDKDIVFSTGVYVSYISRRLKTSTSHSFFSSVNTSGFRTCFFYILNSKLATFCWAIDNFLFLVGLSCKAFSAFLMLPERDCLVRNGFKLSDESVDCWCSSHVIGTVVSLAVSSRDWFKPSFFLRQYNLSRCLSLFSFNWYFLRFSVFFIHSRQLLSLSIIFPISFFIVLPTSFAGVFNF